MSTLESHTAKYINLSRQILQTAYDRFRVPTRFQSTSMNLDNKVVSTISAYNAESTSITGQEKSKFTPELELRITSAVRIVLDSQMQRTMNQELLATWLGTARV